jgi:hypothetical protein
MSDRPERKRGEESPNTLPPSGIKGSNLNKVAHLRGASSDGFV